ncbi:MAG: hypothetical protein JWO90_253, partial [Solirubrobacterales bacterium]|nr:hypothetical protein [Solirubrobacterales bacterium]
DGGTVVFEAAEGSRHGAGPAPLGGGGRLGARGGGGT